MTTTQVTTSIDAAYMAEAIRLAEKGRYSTHPNPCVGSVLVKDGVIIGRGFHLKAGEGHAEANALLQAGDAARGATCYCTLEPCSFHGRTPSCAKALIEAGIKRVVVAMVDPDQRNAGKSLSMLRDAGIEVDCGLMESSARALNPGHVKRHEQGLPYVRLKLAMSQDGKTALANGESQWITGAAARRDVQKLRARSGAIVTGVQTVLDDDPLLNVRAAELDVDEAELSASIRRPVIVLDPSLRLGPEAKLMSNPDTVIACLDPGAKAAERELMVVADDGSGRIDLAALLRQLAQREYSDVLFECGATLAGALVAQGLVDEIIVYVAPVLLGADARSLLNMQKIDSMHDRIELEITDIRHIGEDVRITCRRITA